MSATALWLTVVAIGLFHGLNPAMGWPLAVARGLERRRGSAVAGALLPLAGGHLLAMALVLLPFAWLAAVAPWARSVRLVAALLVLAFGVLRLLRPRHPRALARVRPTQLAWWSFLMATAHGAGLMLLPVMLGLCAAPTEGEAVERLLRSGPATALAVSLLHTVALLAAGGAAALLVYRWLGLRALRSMWFDLDAAWGASLVVAGAAGVAMAW